MKFIAKYRNLWLALFVGLNCLWLIGCTTAWTGEASSIITLLIPAIDAALGILIVAGVGLSPKVLTAVQDWATQAQAALKQVKVLIDQYNQSAQPGILNEIQALLGTISSNLSTILPTLHITNPTTDAEIAAVFAAVADEIAALIGLIPAIQGKVADHDEVKALLTKLRSAKSFKADFNKKAGVFGKQYQLK